MIEYQLRNLDMGSNLDFDEFQVGPYKIKLKANYEKLQAELSQIASEVSHNDVRNGIHSSTEINTDCVVGENLITASVSCENEENARPVSRFGGNQNTVGIWDLCLILSYLTGRRVFIDQDCRRFSHINHGFRSVEQLEIRKAAKVAWENRDKFRTEKEIRPLWIYLQMNSTPEAELKGLLGCVSLEIIQNIESPPEQLDQDQTLADLINDIKDLIDSSAIDGNLKNALKSSTGNWGGSNAQERFKTFLQSYNIIEPDITGIPLSRVRGIFNMRNGIAHNGEIRKPSWITDSKDKIQTAMYILGSFIPYLIQEYLNRKFGLTELTSVKDNTKYLSEYINHGTWYGENVEIA